MIIVENDKIIAKQPRGLRSGPYSLLVYFNGRLRQRRRWNIQRKLLNEETEETAENVPSDEPRALAGLRRVCQAAECLNNLRTFVLRRKNQDLDELFERFESAVSAELEKTLMRRLKRAINEL